MEVDVTLDRNKNSNEEEAKKKKLESDPKVNRLADKIKGRIVSIEKITR
jgi:hypothetical protein